ncbi:hypothetical protein BY996DRAFT_4579612 [Phakopsora pachyrhizi]|nr:hypothetical protein BY996DRAFT_4579612 [Phakopsora pachyrhizi]
MTSSNLSQQPSSSLTIRQYQPDLNRSRPILKRSRTPYTPNILPDRQSSGFSDPNTQQDVIITHHSSKKRRVSPTGAFSKLSISTSAEGPSTSSTSIVRLPSINSFTANPTFRTDLKIFNPPSCLSEDSIGSDEEVRMRSSYSAYEVEPDRIFVESLSDTDQSQSNHQDADDDPDEEGIRIVEDDLSNRLISSHYMRQRRAIEDLMRANLPVNGSLSSLGCEDDLGMGLVGDENNQLVLYRRPEWPITGDSDPEGVEGMMSDVDCDEAEGVVGKVGCGEEDESMDLD